MIRALDFDIIGNELELSFRQPPLSDRSGLPIIIGLGDPVTGPLLGLFYDAPSTPEQLAGPPDLTPSHSHPCDNFRIVMKGELWVGPERYRHGEFRLQQSGRPYGRDGDAPHVEGNWRIIFFADRRGHRVRPTNPKLRAEASSPEAFASAKEYLGDLLPEILPDADDGVHGLVTTIDRPFSKVGHIDGSFVEADTWVPVGSERYMAISIMGMHDFGPTVILQRTSPGAQATPAVHWKSDVFRCVIRGNYRRGSRLVQMGDCILKAAGNQWDEVIAGPEGLDELIVAGDRRGVLASESASDEKWVETVTATTERLLAGLQSLETV